MAPPVYFASVPRKEQCLTHDQIVVVKGYNIVFNDKSLGMFEKNDSTRSDTYRGTRSDKFCNLILFYSIRNSQFVFLNIYV